jgi:hypothetical protein
MELNNSTPCTKSKAPSIPERLLLQGKLNADQLHLGHLLTLWNVPGLW